MIRKILAPIRGDGKGSTVLRHAAALAGRFNAHIEATHCRPNADDLLPFGVPIPGFLRSQIAEQAKGVSDAEEVALRAEFDALVAEMGLDTDAAAVGRRPSVVWIEESGKQVDVIRRHGRLCDVIVVAKPDRDRNLGTNTLKASLFHVGRPVLMCPPTETPPKTLGATVAIAWNGSLEATRAAAMTLGLLKQADAVTILSVDGGDGRAGCPDAFQAYLAMHGIEAATRLSTATDSVGATLLSESAAAGADLLIMGAYGDSHERETLFGGNTQTIVDTAARPVLFVH